MLVKYVIRLNDSNRLPDSKESCYSVSRNDSVSPVEANVEVMLVSKRGRTYDLPCSSVLLY